MGRVARHDLNGALRSWLAVGGNGDGVTYLTHTHAHTLRVHLRQFLSLKQHRRNMTFLFFLKADAVSFARFPLTSQLFTVWEMLGFLPQALWQQGVRGGVRWLRGCLSCCLGVLL